MLKNLNYYKFIQLYEIPPTFFKYSVVVCITLTTFSQGMTTGRRLLKL